MNVVVLAGGNSGEREVSLRSGRAVAAALRQAGHQVNQLDPAAGLKADDFTGTDVIFPVLHGAGGEDGSLQAQLDTFGVPYVGSSVAASKLCFDKWQYKQLLRDNDLPTPKAEIVDETGFWQSRLIKHPFVLKPNDGGSSLDTLLARDARTDQAVIADLFSRHPRMLLEELIEGTEITVAVLGDRALPVIEIIPPPDGEFDYDNKYNGESQELCPPRHVAEAVQTRAAELSLRIHRLTDCRDFSRTDLMVDADDRLSVLETNTIPGMTDQSLFPKAAATAGLSMPRLVDELVKMALKRQA